MLPRELKFSGKLLLQISHHACRSIHSSRSMILAAGKSEGVATEQILCVIHTRLCTHKPYEVFLLCRKVMHTKIVECSLLLFVH